MSYEHIDTDRIDRRLDDLWKIGKTDRSGVTRLAYSREESEAIEYVCTQLGSEFTIERDEFGNVFARTDPSADETILLGSHLDTVANGGRLDGTLGVVTALEAIEAALEAHENPPIPPTLAIFRAEESARFGQHTIGSRAAVGEITDDDLDATDRDGISLREAVDNSGCQPDERSSPTLNLDSIAAYYELHIEQGRVLDESDDDIAIVSSIRAPVRYRTTVDGSDDHSGATPMDMRRDAIAAGAEMILEIEQVGSEASTNGDVVTTVGDVSVSDGAINKVCGELSFPIDIRSTDTKHRDRTEKQILRRLREIGSRRDIDVEFDVIDRSSPVELEETVRESLVKLAEECDLAYRVMPSGGGHDAMNFGRASVPTGLVFVPSIDGKSHNPNEETTRSAIEAGTKLLTTAIMNGKPTRTDGAENRESDRI